MSGLCVVAWCLECAVGVLLRCGWCACAVRSRVVFEGRCLKAVSRRGAWKETRRRTVSSIFIIFCDIFIFFWLFIAEFSVSSSPPRIFRSGGNQHQRNPN